MTGEAASQKPAQSGSWPPALGNMTSQYAILRAAAIGELSDSTRMVVLRGASLANLEVIAMVNATANAVTPTGVVIAEAGRTLISGYTTGVGSIDFGNSVPLNVGAGDGFVMQLGSDGTLCSAWLISASMAVTRINAMSRDGGFTWLAGHLGAGVRTITSLDGTSLAITQGADDDMMLMKLAW